MTSITESLGDNYTLAKKQLEAVALRQRALLSNLANSQTPHYKRQDVDKNFENQLAVYLEQNDVESFTKAQPIVRTDADGSCNALGNNVEIDRELLQMNENMVRQQFLLKVAEDTFRNLRGAITGNPF
jgi:flagellar basal-body rod protein FlgB